MSGSPTTFAALDRANGIADFPGSPTDDYPLAAWYRSVREIPLSELALEDICRACRQRIHLLHVVPLALSVLQGDVMAGEMYDGELLVALGNIPVEYWLENATQRQILVSMANRALESHSTNNEVRRDVEEMLKRL